MRIDVERASVQAQGASSQADKVADGDAFDGTTHVFGKPIATGKLIGVAAGSAVLTAIPAFIIAKSSGGSGLRQALIGAGMTLAGGLVGAGLSTFMAGAKVGRTSGQNAHFIKTGQETYSTTCTSTSRTNVGDTNGDGYDDYRSTTNTYPCVKIRDVGYYEWRNATGELRFGRHTGASDGYESLEAARRAVGGDVLFAERDRRFHAYEVEATGVDRITTSHTNFDRHGITRGGLGRGA